MTNQAAYEEFQPDGSKPIKAWTRGVPFDDNAKEQVFNVAQMPFVYRWVAIMPDVHLGYGATIGSVIPTQHAVIPAAVGVDIGCGMMAVQTSLTAGDLPDQLHGVRSAIEAAVPHGRTNRGQPGDKGAWADPPAPVLERWERLSTRYERIITDHPRIRKASSVEHLGTLGTGNHFIEVCLDEQDRVWFMLHSGSRGVGNRIGTYFIELAKQDMKTWMINLPDEDLAYLPEGTAHFRAYIHAVKWAQDYASMNREIMMQAVVGAVRSVGGIPEFTAEQMVVNCHHNYVTKENHFGDNVWVTRKGAVRAREGDLGIIPGSMGARSYIVAGKGNPDSFHSCSHGAGRVMTRAKAKQVFTIEDHVSATADVECRNCL